MTTKANILINQGADFSADVTLLDDDGEPINLTGYTANAEMKTWYSSCNSYAFDVAIVFETGTIILSMNAENTSQLYRERYVYDVIVTSGTGVVTRVIEGIATVDPMVTSSQSS